MDVNSIGKNVNNINAYSLNVSEYTQSNDEVAVPQVQKVETKTSEDNTKKQEYSKKDLDNALNKINNFLKDDKTHAEYTYNEEMKTMMVKVIDENTKEVVLEIPPKKILDMVASMMRQVGLLDKKA
ncbi:flagellar protein FlaG [Clostridium beijerinckii]|uniref:flagellar protein FlaG n=1 Tax=Clostridium beijerinckii TaxID=1520 RepID=UPI000809FC60|nr:flagellar protein FlaG [Clostridium beijerinckii]OCA96809.1 flagellar biosynthesis protein FlaG [Clostridium beijerinckii]